MFIVGVCSASSEKALRDTFGQVSNERAVDYERAGHRGTYSPIYALGKNTTTNVIEQPIYHETG